MALVVYTIMSSSGRAVAQQKLAPRLTAAQLADGILFRDGVAARLLLGKETGATLTPAQRGLERAVDAAVARDGAWEASFATRVQSGDRVKVEQALRDLGVLYRGVLDAQVGAKAVDRALDSTVRALGESVTAADPYTANYQININYEINYVAVDLAIEIAALIVVIIAAFLSPQQVTGPGTGAGARLSIEAFVDRVATNLATT
ncbi:hypothetical protein [Asanoa hainanensis]|uniref:hypothetical protein n=1 Tax=Asanoa hainanensis TaxID=560556 RepID=UPI000B77D2E7|nr:hypothetical protein [Asanoa hainanensis]